MRRAVLLCLLLAAPSLSAHPISIITGEALVHRDRMEMKIAVMPEDFLLVYGLYANAQSRIATDDITKSAEKHKKFLLDGLIVRDADGNRLEGKVVNIEMPTLPADGTAGDGFDGDDDCLSSRISAREAADASHVSTAFRRRMRSRFPPLWIWW